MTDPCKHVNVFYGNGETDRFFEDGLASKWFYIKAQCGNTVPHATLPFGKMSVGAYSGGYPTGYGTHYPNSCGGIKKLSDEMLVSGFSHLHQSGTGDIQFFYNYAVTSPYFGDDCKSTEFRPIKNEQAKPGYYSAELDGISCELTVDGGVALHRYRFPAEGGKVAIDFANDGLSRKFEAKYRAEVKDCTLALSDNDEISFSGIFSGIRLYFAVRVKNSTRGAYLCQNCLKTDSKVLKAESASSPLQAVIAVDGRECELSVAYSTVSAERAREALLSAEPDFDVAAERAFGIWNDTLSKFSIEAEDSLLEKFYSNLYHSLVKPVDMTGEHILGVEGDTVSDFATFWDQYKTVYPLIYFAYPEMAGKIVKGIANISRTLGKIPCSFGLSDIFPSEMQAKMLGVLTLTDAYHMGIPESEESLISECIERELRREDYKEFLECGTFERYTHILDVTDTCFAVAKITKNESLACRLRMLGENWKKAYGDDGFMSDNVPYYEGDKFNYSFRLQNNMEDRVALIGGKEKLAAALDAFFGINGESVRQMTHLNAYPDISKTAYHRFEGFNNEPDMETPYAYVYAGRHDRLEDIIRECVTRSFGIGRAGLPGNNDSGGLSALLVWNMLGIFPESGRGKMLIGLPMVKTAEISLSSGKKLKISTKNNGAQYITRVTFRGREISDFSIDVNEIMGGGDLVVEF